MAPLSRPLRKVLENVVIEAREVAETAAENALKALAVGEAEPYRSMTAEQKALRNRLRAHGRQLGDWRNAEKGTQSLDHLINECAYEHWHRMLFARFLAENELLIEPTNDVSIPLDVVKELARSRGQDWVALAGEFAVPMLPHVFRQDDPVLAVQFTPEDRKHLEELLEALPQEVFTASDSLGWTYQFWQTKRKEEVNASGDKIGADELPAVTQLFTEDYMVDFLLDNTLGAWHAGKVLSTNPELAESAKNEEELRKAVALTRCPWNYLRFVKGADGKWTPAAGTFDGWPKTAKDLRCLDPCMGSGHFIVAMFERLVPLRILEEKLSLAAAGDAVIRDNLFGLEIDPRCTQISAFNVALAAWRRVGHRALPAMNLACSGIAPNARKEEWLRLAGANVRLQSGMERLHQLFKDAATLGSLINPRSTEGDLLEAGFPELRPLLERALARETKDDSAHEMAVTARGLAKAADILANQFSLVATNVPYLGRGKQDDELKEHCERAYPESKADLATCFLERCLDFTELHGTATLVVPQNWLFLGTYKRLRKTLLVNSTLEFVVRLGEYGFESQAAAGAFTALVGVTHSMPDKDHSVHGLDASAPDSPTGKAAVLLREQGAPFSQASQLGNPDARITLENETSLSRLGDYATTWQGLVTGDTNRFTLCFWERYKLDEMWEWFVSSPQTNDDFVGRSLILRWEQGKGSLHRDSTAHNFPPAKALGRRGILLSQIRTIRTTLYLGEIFNDLSVPLIPRDPLHLAPIYAFAKSPFFRESVRNQTRSLQVRVGYFLGAPFDLAHWQEVAAEEYPDGLAKPFSRDPTQWLFSGHPKGSDQPLHVAVARLLGYQWPRQTGASFPDCPVLGADGLERHVDSDGIVCLTSLKGEEAAAERMRKLLAAAYGREWAPTKQSELLAQVGFGSKTLDDWLRDSFFEQHCALFNQRPFIWHIWDGERDGFHALVNYHLLAAPDGHGRKTLEKLTYSYLGDWIGRQKAEQKQGKEGADSKVAAGMHLQEQLKKIIEGEPPYDLFVRWKPLHKQAIRWEPDINDGVRINIRPFMMATTLKGKSIFRKAPKIKWEKDRGREPKRAKQDFPWFWSWDEETDDFKGGRDFDGNRWNDLHYSNQVKRAARTRNSESRR
jgi:hypothetical protein